MGKPADYNEAESDPTSPEKIMTSSLFWPSVNLDEVRAQAGIDGSVAEARLFSAVFEAVIHTNKQLAAWEAKQKKAGFDALEKIEPETVINGVSVLVLLYKAAIKNHAAATIYASLRDYGETAESSKKSSSHTTKADEFRAAGRSDINMIMGLGRAEAYLI